MATQSQNPNIEAIALAYREAIYGSPVKPDAWEASRKHWMEDTEKFITLLARSGLEIVEKKPVKQS